MRILLPCLMLYLLYLLGERIALNRWRRRIPIRIAVTGTRGKSSVARMLASVLREGGYRVVAKTTGSEALITLPDGGRVELGRDIPPSVLEQKELVHRAARVKADCLVAEVMSIRPENHYIESRRLLRPNLVAITNVRRDHTDVMGETEEKIASVLNLDICPQSTVFVPENENCALFRAEAERQEAALIPVTAGTSAMLSRNESEPDRCEFAENLDLVCAIAAHIGIPPSTIAAGIRKAEHDIGRLRIWSLPRPDAGYGILLVNAFAANDPKSTFQVLSRVRERYPAAAGRMVGILSLRADRVPRTVQWIEALHREGMRHFRILYVTGGHARLVQRRLPQARVLRARTPERMMSIVLEEANGPTIVFGFGNLKGSGKALVEYWMKTGTLCTGGDHEPEEKRSASGPPC